jgi:hypothetical protein
MAYVSIAAVSPTPPVPLPATATPTEVLANNAAFQRSLSLASSSAATTPAPPVPLPATATPTEVLANNAAFQQSLLQATSDTAQAASPSYSSAFAPSSASSAIDPPWSSASDSITFQPYLVDTFLSPTSTAAPNPFGTTLPGLGLGSLAYAAPAQPNPFAQHGLGINVSALQ